MTNNTPKNSYKFVCIVCDFKCIKKQDYNRHLSTAKHNKMTNSTVNTQLSSSKFKCDCGNEYKYRQGLHLHKQKCAYTSLLPPENTFVPSPQSDSISAEPTTVELLGIIQQLVIQNATTSKQFEELQNTMKDLIPRIGNNNTTNTNSHNNTFNIQMFLENECKNAISIQDFVKSVEINMSHLVAMSKDGYVDSISNVLINALNNLAVTDRPLHCTDLKRETVYIKDKETWNKSSADTSVMDKVISNIERKHVVEVKNFVDEHPQSQELDTPDHQFYQKVYYNSLGAGEDSDKLNKKIYKKVLPQVKLEKLPV